MSRREVLRWIGIIVIVSAFLVPLYWMVSTSLKGTSEIRYQLTYYPHEPNLANFNKVFSGVWLRSIINSVYIAAGVTAICFVFGFPAAYAFSRSSFKADKHLFFWFLVNRMAPPAVFIIPYFAMYCGIGLFDTVWAVILAHTLFNLPLSIWILSGFMSSVPKHMDEAAFIDGHGLLSYFRRIFIRMMGPGIGVTLFFLWIFSWTEMLLASTLTAVSAKPLTVQLMITLAAMGTGIDWGAAAAAGVVSLIPGVILLYFVRKYITKGFTFGRV